MFRDEENEYAPTYRPYVPRPETVPAVIDHTAPYYGQQPQRPASPQYGQQGGGWQQGPYYGQQPQRLVSPQYGQQGGGAPQDPAPQPPTPRPAPKKSSGMRTGSIFLLTVVLMAIFGVGLFAGWQYAGGSVATTTTTHSTTSSGSSNVTVSSTLPQTQRETAIEKIKPSVVELDVTTNQGQQLGSGVIIDKNGDIITNNHVVDGAQTIKVVLYDGRSMTAQLVGTAAQDDLAVVHVQPFAKMVVATIGDSTRLTVGQNVLAVGNPLGITETVTSGIISALNRSVSESNTVTINNAIQTDAAINPGNSGGALINEQGELIGIPTLTAINTESNTPANGVGFAIPSSLVKTALSQIIQQPAQ
ncbi:S1C family serine protease [Dictyobacter aurantiacus]|nr:trypsin-like peptidase domain-containing protein [Dictyobacter aurantiacus]